MVSIKSKTVKSWLPGFTVICKDQVREEEVDSMEDSPIKKCPKLQKPRRQQPRQKLTQQVYIHDAELELFRKPYGNRVTKKPEKGVMNKKAKADAADYG